MAKTEQDKPSIHVKFTGMQTAGDFDQLPEIGGMQEFTVKARCVSAPHGKLMADGHVRTEVGMKVLEVQPGKIQPAPAGDPQLDFDGDQDDEAEASE